MDRPPHTLVVATRNAGKVRELSRLFEGLDLALVGLPTDAPDVIEDADSFEGNASKKARETAAYFARRGEHVMTLADDSGLEVDALGGAPGIHSARYAGAQGDDEANNQKLLAALERTPDHQRTARFVCVLALVDPNGPLGEAVHLERGTIEGTIVRERRGAGGFGYDPLFLPLGEVRTTAEMPSEEKNQVSHRAEASRKMRAFLAKYLAE